MTNPLNKTLLKVGDIVHSEEGDKLKIIGLRPDEEGVWWAELELLDFQIIRSSYNTDDPDDPDDTDDPDNPDYEIITYVTKVRVDEIKEVTP